MAVGTLAGMHVSVGSTYIDITFTRPSNCTKIVFTVTPTNLVGSAISHTYTIPLVYAIGASITYRFTGLSSTQVYYLTGTPYNGSTAGTVRNYSNSGSTPVNSIKMPSAKITTPAPVVTTTTKSPTTASSGSGAVSPTSPVGGTTNNGTIATSGAAGSNTPTIIPGATDASVPSDLNSPSRLSLKIPDLAPNQTYSIKVRALTTDSSGQTVYSEYSSPIYLTTPGFGADGTNILSLNNNGDLQLKGGSIFAGDFGTDAGLIDVVSGTTTGTGVILNQTGLAGFAAGTKEFYIDAATGNAYFAGTIQATIIESTDYNGLTDGSAFSVNGTAINLNNGTITGQEFRIDTSGNAYFGGSVTANADISGTAASTVVSNAQLGVTAYTYAHTAVQPGTFLKVDNTNQVVTVDTRGINITSSATASANSTSRIEMTNGYFTAYAGNTPTFQIQASTGSVVMTGQVTATSGYIGSASQGWSINSDNITSQSGNLVLKASDGSISGGTITGSLFKTSTGSTRIEIGSLNTATNQYDNINFWSSSTSGSTYGGAGRLLVGGGSNTATLVLSAPNFDTRNNLAAMLSMTSYSDGTAWTTLFGDFSVSAGIVRSATYDNSLRGISQTTSSVTAGSSIGSGHSNGDILLVYS